MLILASLSPRRRELMRLITENFIAVPPACNEELPCDISPEEAVELLAHRKALSVFPEHPRDIVIGADTVVVLDNVILGKPKNKNEAACMLSSLSGREHEVYTGVAIVSKNYEKIFHERTLVRLRDISPEEIRAYIATGEPMDKAGAYGIQGKAAIFVSGNTGDYHNVVGLPICALSKILKCNDLL